MCLTDLSPWPRGAHHVLTHSPCNPAGRVHAAAPGPSARPDSLQVRSQGPASSHGARAAPSGCAPPPASPGGQPHGHQARVPLGYPSGAARSPLHPPPHAGDGPAGAHGHFSTPEVPPRAVFIGKRRAGRLALPTAAPRHARPLYRTQTPGWSPRRGTSRPWGWPAALSHRPQLAAGPSTESTELSPSETHSSPGTVTAIADAPAGPRPHHSAATQEPHAHTGRNSPCPERAARTPN